MSAGTGRPFGEQRDRLVAFERPAMASAWSLAPLTWLRFT